MSEDTHREKYASYSRACAYLLDVVIGYQTRGLILFVGVRLLLSPPPVILAILLEKIEDVAFGNGQLSFALRLIVVYSLVYTEESHDGSAVNERLLQ